MSDSYQAIYDAVRSRISGSDIGSVIREVAFNAFDISWQKDHAQQAICEITNAYSRPSAVFRPTLSLDGNKWCALLGDDLQTGVAGFGDTPELACVAFDAAWLKVPNARVMPLPDPPQGE